MRKAASAVLFVLIATVAFASPPDRWLHIRVQNGASETVRINVPLSLAEKMLPAVRADKMRGGRLRIGRDDVFADPHALFEAVRTAADGEFVTVQHGSDDVRVAKERGYLLV